MQLLYGGEACGRPAMITRKAWGALAAQQRPSITALWGRASGCLTRAASAPLRTRMRMKAFMITSTCAPVKSGRVAKTMKGRTSAVDDGLPPEGAKRSGVPRPTAEGDDVLEVQESLRASWRQSREARANARGGPGGCFDDDSEDEEVRLSAFALPAGRRWRWRTAWLASSRAA